MRSWSCVVMATESLLSQKPRKVGPKNFWRYWKIQILISRTSSNINNDASHRHAHICYPWPLNCMQTRLSSVIVYSATGFSTSHSTSIGERISGPNETLPSSDLGPSPAAETRAMGSPRLVTTRGCPVRATSSSSARQVDLKTSTETWRSGYFFVGGRLLR